MFYDKVIDPETLSVSTSVQHPAPVKSMRKIKNLALHRFCDNVLHMSINGLCSFTGAAVPLVLVTAPYIARLSPYMPSAPAIAIGGIGSVLLGTGLGLHDANRADNTHARTGLSYDYDARLISIGVPYKRLRKRIGLGVGLMSTLLLGDFMKTTLTTTTAVHDFSKTISAYTTDISTLVKEQTVAYYAPLPNPAR